MNLATIVDGGDADAPALVSRAKATTYGELRDAISRIRGGLSRLGIEPGDRVALMLANNPQFVVSYFAVLGVGAVAVPLNPASPAAELRLQLTTVGARAGIVGPTARAAIVEITGGESPLAHIVAADGVDVPGATPLAELFGGEPSPIVDRNPDDLAALLFTAGTAGSPKAAMLTHGNLRANLEQTQQDELRALRSDDVVLGVLPMFHIFGLNVTLGLTLFAGASVVLIERFDPVSSLDSIRDRGITIVAGAPPMYAAWASVPGADAAAFRSVRVAVSGAAALATDTAEAFEARFGLPVYEGYGLTEASPTVASAIVGGAARAGSVGLPLPGVEVRLVDDDGQDVLAGDPGEVWVRGPNVFKGYWHDEDATARALTPDGWLRTGDMAVADADGYLHVVDRAKDLIIVSGFNVYPAEVETVLCEHPVVEAAAVVGVAHPYSGETVKAFVVTSGAAVDEDELVEFCAARLARYKCPTKIMFVDALPQGLGGKLVRRALQ